MFLWCLYSNCLRFQGIFHRRHIQGLSGCIAKEAKACSFFIGLQIAQEFTSHQMIIKRDCLVVVKFLLELENSPPWRIRAIIQDCWNIMNISKNNHISHVPRASNNVACCMVAIVARNHISQVWKSSRVLGKQASIIAFECWSKMTSIIEWIKL